MTGLPRRLRRVAIVGFYPADPARISGGIRSVTYLLVEGLRQHSDLEIHVIHCHSDMAEDRVVSQSNLTLHFLAQPQRRLIPNMVTGIPRIARLLQQLQPDVVNAHGHSYAVASLRAGFNPIWTVHGVVREEARYLPGLSNRLQSALAAQYERQALVQVRRMTAISPYIREQFAARTQAHWWLTENPAPDDLFDLPRRPVPGRLLLPAAVIPRKDPITLIRALALLADAFPALHLHIAGRINEAAYVRQVQAAAQKLGVAERVTLLGVQSQTQMRRHYTEAQLVVLSSREEVSPMSLIEGLAAGVPVVTTRAGGAAFIVDESVTGLTVPVGDAPALAEALRSILCSPHVYQSMSAAARPAAEARFRLTRVVDAYLAAYEAALEEG